MGMLPALQIRHRLVTSWVARDHGWSDPYRSMNTNPEGSVRECLQSSTCRYECHVMPCNEADDALEALCPCSIGWGITRRLL